MPTEMLYLETGELDIPNVISVRRLLYWQNVICRKKGELINQIYSAMKDNPIKGDWIHLVVDDLKKINMSLENEKHVQKMTKKEFKDIIMEKTRMISFNEQVIKKASHEKVKNVSHASLTKPESYLTSDKVTNKLSSLIFNLRCRSQKEFKTNFNKMYECKLCPMCQEENDSQEHALSCRVTSQKLNDKT